MRWKFIVAAYVAVGILTFGYAAAKRADWYATTCAGRLHGGPILQDCIIADDGVGTGLAAAVLWPLYWSWEAWS